MRVKASFVTLTILVVIFLPKFTSAQATCGDTLVCSTGSYGMYIRGQGILALLARARGANAIQAYSPYNTALIASSNNSYAAKFISKNYKALYASGKLGSIVAESDSSSTIFAENYGDGSKYGVRARVCGMPVPDPDLPMMDDYPVAVSGYADHGIGVMGSSSGYYGVYGIGRSMFAAVRGYNDSTGDGGSFLGSKYGISCDTLRVDKNYGLYTGCNVYIGGKIDLIGTVDPVIGERFEFDPEEGLEVGDVIVIDDDSQYVTRCSEANDTKVLGVIGPEVDVQNGEVMVITFGNRGAQPVPDAEGQIAERTIIRVKVDTKYGAIKRGDLLTTSPTLGHAMKAVPVEIQGRKIFPPGTIIGKALESLESGTGLIEVFVMNI